MISVLEMKTLRFWEAPNQWVSGRIEIWTQFVWFQTVNRFYYPMMCLRLSKLALLVSAGAEGGEQFSSVPEWNLECMPIEIIL